jgi:hypothetical protein
MAGGRAKVLALLAGAGRARFLADLAGCLGVRARGEYTEAGNEASRAIVALCAVNELQIVVADQLRSALRGNAAYPDAAWHRLLDRLSTTRIPERIMRDPEGNEFCLTSTLT